MNSSAASNISFRTLAAAVLSIAAAHAALAQAEYQIVGLESLGETGSWAHSINAAGQTVGRAHTAFVPVPGTDMQVSSVHAFLFHGGAMSDLGTLPGHAVSSAQDINQHGHVVGYSASGQRAAFFWTDGVMTPLQSIAGFSSVAHAINDSDLIVGWITSTGPGAADLPVQWIGGSISMLPMDQDWSAAIALNINNAGATVGTARLISNEEDHAVVWIDGAGIDLGTLGASPFSSAGAINDAGQIVGTSGIQHPTGMWLYRAVRWNDGVIEDLGSLGGYASQAFDINTHGHIVGTASAGESDHAFLWRDGRMIDLNDFIEPDSGWVLNEAHAINDAGQIVGAGRYLGDTQAFRLDPIEIECPPADLTGDCAVNSLDLGRLLDAWTNFINGRLDPASDLNGDGVINGIDLGILLSNWG